MREGEKRNEILNVRLVTSCIPDCQTVTSFSPLATAMTIPREICKAKRRRFAPLSFLAAFRDVVLVWGDTSRDLPGRRLTYIHAGFTRDIFVLKSRVPVLRIRRSSLRRYDFAVFVPGSTVPLLLLPSFLLVDLPFLFLVVVYL